MVGHGHVGNNFVIAGTTSRIFTGTLGDGINFTGTITGAVGTVLSLQAQNAANTLVTMGGNMSGFSGTFVALDNGVGAATIDTNVSLGGFAAPQITRMLLVQFPSDRTRESCPECRYARSLATSPTD